MQAIESAAIRLFMANGPADVSLRAIAREAGVTYSLVHKYFESSHAVLQLVGRHFSENSFDRIGRLRSIDELVQYSIDRLGRQKNDWVQLVAWSLLQGIPVDQIQDQTAGWRKSIELLDQAKGASSADTDEARTGMFLMMCLMFGWQLFGELLITAAGLESHSDDQIVAALQAAVYRLLDMSPAPADIAARTAHVYDFAQRTPPDS